MKLARNGMLVAAGALVLLGAMTSQVVAQELPVVRVVTEVMPRQSDLLPMLENHSNLRGRSSNVTVDGNNFCFGATPQTVFSGGQTAALSVIWDDPAEADLITGICDVQRRRLERRGEFPQRFKLAENSGRYGGVGWRFSDLQRWIQRRAATARSDSSA